MQSEGNPVQEYMEKRKHVMNYFKCEGEFFIKPLLNARWFISSEGDYFILSYWEKDKPKTNAVIVKRAGEPLIYKTERYTMVIAIDCVKIAFLFENEKKGA